MNPGRSILVILFLLNTSLAVAQFKLYEKGHDSYTSGKYPEAVKFFSEYLTKGTRDKALDVEVFYLRALSYYKSSQYKEAEGDFQECLLLDHPNSGNIYWFLAKCYDKTNALDESVSAYTAAIRILNGTKDSKEKLLWERSQIYTRMNNLPMAYLDFKSLTSLQPSNTQAAQEMEKLEKQGIKAPSTAATVVAATQQVTDKPQEAKGRSTDTNSPAKSSNSGTVASGGPGSSDSGSPKPADAAKSDASKSTATVPTNASVADAGSTLVGSNALRLSPLAEMYKDEKRYALVIGNSNYPKSIGVLKNPVNDATDFARELQSSGFEVQLLTNATYGQMRAAMLRFKEKVDAGDKAKTVSLFYYAGHGVQRDEENYLVPIDAIVEFEDDIQRYCFPVQRMVLSNMERSNSRMNIVILDACRNNPFPAVNRSIGDEGLGEMKRAMGSFIAYATAPGSVASDGTGRNGLYTQELIKAVKKPGLTIEQVFKDVRQNVLRLSGNKQNTWDSSNIIGEFYFKFPQ